MQYKEKIDKIEQKINQLKAQKQALLAREKEKERKARTIRLIQIGAIIENIGIDNIEFNYITGSVIITYNPDKLNEKIVINWINHVLNIVLENINFIQEFGEDNIDYVVNTLQNKLKETLCKCSI